MQDISWEIRIHLSRPTGLPLLVLSYFYLTIYFLVVLHLVIYFHKIRQLVFYSIIRDFQFYILTFTIFYLFEEILGNFIDFFSLALFNHIL